MFGQSLLSGAFGGAACTTDTDQLFTSDVTATSIATYQLNNATTSIPSNTYPGTFTNAAYATGKFGNAASFSGNGYIQTGLPGSIFNTNTFSISFWYKRTTSSQFEYILGTTDTGILNGFAIGVYDSSGGYRFDIITRNGSSTLGRYQGGGNVLNVWTNIVMSVNNNEWTFYQDGSLMSDRSGYTQPMDGDTYNNSNPLYLGRAGAYATEPLTSSYLDQVRIFNTALPQGAVTTLYNETVATSSSASINYANANPNSIAYYKMSNASDQLGNYNGTATNVNFNTEGNFGFAGKFNGSDSYVSLPAGVNKNNNFSWSFWIKFNTLTLYDTTIGFQNTYRNYLDITASGALHFYDGVSLYSPASTVATSTWYNIVITKSSSTGRKMYVNSSEVASDSSTANSIAGGSGGLNLIGAYQSGSGFAYYTDSSIDQIRIYDSAISAADVTTLYNEIECPAATIVNSFNTVVYTGNGGTNPISTVGFKPDFTWIKQRSGTRWHELFDSIRGVTKRINSNVADAQGTASTSLTSFDTNGFTLGNDLDGNENGQTFVAWNWKGSGITDTNTDGTITSSVSANKEAGFSVVRYTGNASPSTVGHGLGKPAELILVKVTSASASWAVYSEPTGINKYLELDNAGLSSNYSNYWGPAAPTNSVFGVVDGNFNNNSSGATLIAYCFASIPGYSRVGSYIGTGGSLTVYVGFEPSFVMIKRTDADGNWVIVDDKRANGDNRLYANLSNAEDAGQGESFTSTGFSPRQSSTNDTNISGGTYIYLAIA
jgi:hypothetical protein